MMTKKPVSLDLKYLTRQGFDFTERRLQSTIRQLTASELVRISEGTVREQTGNSEGTEQEQEPKTVATKGLKSPNHSLDKKRVDKSRVDKKKTNNLSKPNLSQIKAYAHEENLEHLDCEFFLKYFTTSDWVDGKGNKVKNWKLKAQTWNKSKANSVPQPRNRDEKGKIQVAL
jgi:hypothetical protein